MKENLNPNERELIKLVSFFKKRVEKLALENKLETDYVPMIETCNKLVEQLTLHAKNREIILGERVQLEKLVKDNAQCPKCFKNANLKLIGIDKSVQGWKSNKYKCRRCNIEFVWNAPNNPWDMIAYVEHFILTLEERSKEADLDEDTKSHNIEAVSQMKANLGKLKPIVEASEADMAELEVKEKQMAEMISKVKKHLLIEKIRMDI